MKKFERTYKGFQIYLEDESEFTASNPHWIIIKPDEYYHSYSVYPPYDPISFIDNMLRPGGKKR